MPKLFYVWGLIFKGAKAFYLFLLNVFLLLKHSIFFKVKKIKGGREEPSPAFEPAKAQGPF